MIRLESWTPNSLRDNCFAATQPKAQLFTLRANTCTACTASGKRGVMDRILLSLQKLMTASLQHVRKDPEEVSNNKGLCALFGMLREQAKNTGIFWISVSTVFTVHVERGILPSLIRPRKPKGALGQSSVGCGCPILASQVLRPPGARPAPGQAERMGRLQQILQRGLARKLVASGQWNRPGPERTPIKRGNSPRHMLTGT